jgi:hypothetical protein
MQPCRLPNVARTRATRRALLHCYAHAIYASERAIACSASIRRVDKFNVHPNELREFVPGQAAIKCVAHQRYTIARVYLDTPDKLLTHEL